MCSLQIPFTACRQLASPQQRGLGFIRTVTACGSEQSRSFFFLFISDSLVVNSVAMVSSNAAQLQANSHPQANGVPSASVFSFKAPLPLPATSSAGATALKQRRVSLASQSSPRVVQPWCFRDEMGLDAQSNDPSSSTLAPDKKGKFRKPDSSTTPDDPPSPEKKPRKKWTQEETMMLVDGCQIVRSSSFPPRHFEVHSCSIPIAWSRELEDYLTRPQSQIPRSYSRGSQR